MSDVSFKLSIVFKIFLLTWKKIQGKLFSSVVDLSFSRNVFPLVSLKCCKSVLFCCYEFLNKVATSIYYALYLVHNSCGSSSKINFLSNNAAIFKSLNKRNKKDLSEVNNFKSENVSIYFNLNFWLANCAWVLSRRI